MNAGQLAKFKLVIWNNTSGDPLTEAQRTAFKTWVENGGSYMGVHGAGGDPVENQRPHIAGGLEMVRRNAPGRAVRGSLRDCARRYSC